MLQGRGDDVESSDSSDDSEDEEEEVQQFVDNVLAGPIRLQTVTSRSGRQSTRQAFFVEFTYLFFQTLKDLSSFYETFTAVSC